MSEKSEMFTRSNLSKIMPFIHILSPKCVSLIEDVFEDTSKEKVAKILESKNGTFIGEEYKRSTKEQLYDEKYILGVKENISSQIMSIMMLAIFFNGKVGKKKVVSMKKKEIENYLESVDIMEFYNEVLLIVKNALKFDKGGNSRKLTIRFIY